MGMLQRYEAFGYDINKEDKNGTNIQWLKNKISSHFCQPKILCF